MINHADILGRWLRPLVRGQTGPSAKFAYDMLLGMLMSQSVYLSAIARELDCSEGTDDDVNAARHIARRLSKHLASPRFDEVKVREHYLKWVARVTGRNHSKGCVVAVDYTDISKRFAKLGGVLELACLCHDGSEKPVGDAKSKNGVGYPVVQMVLDHPSGVSYPLDLHPYSHTAETRGQTGIFVDRIGEVKAHEGRRAWWAFDRGFDGSEFLEGYDRHNIRWLVRVQLGHNSRGVFDEKGHWMRISDLAKQVTGTITHTFQREDRRGRMRTYTVTLGTATLRLSDQKRKPSPIGPERSLVVVRGFGDNPMLLLAGERLWGEEAIVEAFQVYGRRWKCEVSTRAMKQPGGWGVALENLAVYRGVSVKRMLFFVVMLYGFLADLPRRRPAVARPAVRVARSVSTREPTFPISRLLKGTGALLQGSPDGERERARRRIGRSRATGTQRSASASRS